MGLSRRIRNIAIGQINAIKERLDRLDAEAEETDPRARADAQREVAGEIDDLTPLRSPEEIAGGVLRTSSSSRPASRTESPLARHYRVLGLNDGADLSEVEAAYANLASRCSPARFADGSDEAAAAAEILRRVDTAYAALRDALDPTAGRFGKLEI
jgi:hypothetical protein